MVYVTTKNTLIVINQQLKIFIIKYSSCMGKYVHLMEKSLKFVNLEKFLHGQ